MPSQDDDMKLYNNTRIGISNVTTEHAGVQIPVVNTSSSPAYSFNNWLLKLSLLNTFYVHFTYVFCDIIRLSYSLKCN